jgi:hypothetical protein
MQYLAGLMLVARLFDPTQEFQLVKTSPLILTVECKNNPTCTFSGEDIPIRIIFRNSSTSEIGVPLEHIEKKGPYVKLIDAKTGNERRLPVSLPAEELLSKFHIIKPLDSIEMESKLTAGAIRTFRRELIDLSVELVISTEIQIDGIEIIEYREIGKFVVKGKDTVERDGKF